MKRYIPEFAAMLLLLAAAPQQSDAQSFLKKLGKAFEDAAKEVVSSVENATTTATQTAQQTAKNTVTATITTPQKVHTTAATKKIVIDGGVSHLGAFSNGRAIVTAGKKQFVIDKQGNRLFDIPTGYAPKGIKEDLFSNEGIGYDSNRLMVFSRDKKIAIIYDENGKIVKKFENTNNASGFCDGVALIEKLEKKPGHWIASSVWYYIDINGNTLSSTMPVSDYSGGPTYRLFPLREGLSPVYDKEQGKWGYRDAQCKWVIPPTYGGFGADDGGGFYNGLSRAKDKESEKWGFINKQGQWVIQPIYTIRPGNFYGKYAIVKDKAGVYYFMDKTGKLVWQEKNRGAITLREFLPKDISIWSDQQGSYIIDAAFNKKKQINNFQGSLTTYTDSYFQWRYETSNMTVRNQLLDWDGNLLLQFDGESIIFSDGMCAQSNYYFNEQGEVIVMFEDTKF